MFYADKKGVFCLQTLFYAETEEKSFVCLQLLFCTDRKRMLCLQVLFYSDRKTRSVCLQLLFYSDRGEKRSVCSYCSTVTGKNPLCLSAVIVLQ